MNTPNTTPMNPVISLTSLPQPQVVSGTLGEQGKPLPAQSLNNLLSIIDQSQIANTDFVGTFNITTAMAPGTQLMKAMLPFFDGVGAEDNEQDFFRDRPVNWNSFELYSHEYYDPIQTLSFVFVGPQPMVGKILITYNPGANTALAYQTDEALYRPDRRAITKEWDLALSKNTTISIEGFKLYDKRPIYATTINAADPVLSPGFLNPRISLHAFNSNIGTISLNVIQRLQQFSIFPTSYTVMIFSSFTGTKMYTPRDPRNAIVGANTPLYNYANHVSFDAHPA